jgi:thiamine-monophosphate kinase
VESHLVLRQNQARAGDLIAVTGELGGSAAGLALLLNPQLSLPLEVRDRVLALHNRPHPRVHQGRLFARSRIVTTAKDISDGLSKEILAIARSSHQGAVIWANRIPILQETREVAARLNINPLNLAINGGEDYELLFTFSPANLNQLQFIASQENISFTVVGEIVPEDLGHHIVDSNGIQHPLEAKGYNHFQGV